MQILHCGLGADCLVYPVMERSPKNILCESQKDLVINTGGNAADFHLVCTPPQCTHYPELYTIQRVPQRLGEAKETLASAVRPASFSFPVGRRCLSAFSQRFLSMGNQLYRECLSVQIQSCPCRKLPLDSYLQNECFYLKRRFRNEVEPSFSKITEGQHAKSLNLHKSTNALATRSSHCSDRRCNLLRYSFKTDLVISPLSSNTNIAIQKEIIWD